MLRDPSGRVGWLLALALLWAPLPFGSVGLLSRSALVMAILLLFSVTVALADSVAPLRPVAAPALAVLLVAALGATQLVLGSRLVVPSEDGSAPASFVLGSVAPWASGAAAFVWTGMAAALAVAAYVGRRRSGRRLLAAALLAAGLFQALFGGQRWAFGRERIWGQVVPGDAQRLRGTFVNPDHLAYFLGLCLPLVLAWGWWSVRRASRESEWGARLQLVAPPALSWATLFVALALTGSRGGLLAVAAVTLAQLGVALLADTARDRGPGRAAVAGLFAFAVVCCAVTVWLQERAFGRLLQTSPIELRWNDRIEVYRGTLELWQRFPISGSGLGSFRDAFPLTQPRELERTWFHAHSDPLEMLATTGVVGAALMAVALLAVVRRLSRIWRVGLRSEDRAAGLGALGTVAVAVLHSSVDFGLSLPVNALALALIVGACLAVPLNGRP